MRLAPLRVLMVEDSPADRRLFQLECANRFPFRLDTVADGERALAVLAAESEPFDLILLDLNLPKVHGFEVLAATRESTTHRCCPVVILTSSGSADDVVRAYDLGASCFIQKPTDLERYTEMCTAMLEFWTQIVILPRGRVA